MKQHKRINAVKYYREAKLHHAALMDLWEYGALLKTETDIIPKESEGKTGEYYLATKYGRTKFRGIIKDVSQRGNIFCWEVDFIEVSPHKEDPLRRLIEEIVCLDSGGNGRVDEKIYG